MKKAISTTDAPKATGPFSQAVVESNLILTSGQIHLDKDGNLVEGTIEEKTHQVLNNLQAILAATGLDFGHVLKATIYVTDMANYSAINGVYATYFAEPFPAREVVCVKALPLGADLEISLVAISS